MFYRWHALDFRDCIQRIDVEGIQARRKTTLHRRIYNVLCPNQLWHINTNHKLIRWHFIIAGGIDGFSRFIVYLKCIQNNKAKTILECLKEGVEKYGIPVRVRSDQGMENYSVAMFMLENRGEKGMITGKSNYNQRIERLWRDVYEGDLSLYYDLFYFMEDEGLLNPLDAQHIYALHHVFFDKINEKLFIWQNAWASHRMRTVRSSPRQLFISGCANNHVTITLPSFANGEHFEDVSQIDELQMEKPRPTIENIHSVSENFQRELGLNCPKGWTSSNFGIDIYIKALEIIKRNVDNIENH
ncbi:hypothetical protein DPMN_158961 [Dreissena polymorpha]|uniref:Integrase catalytic domain-containing protein n=1 Tax=Dreissena polymorpha TaxID=45954 RepID=A0A9D4EMD2_DREPO|nr:hypothetical protein DPMN_158961 [Dreissena polymorpha]